MAERLRSQIASRKGKIIPASLCILAVIALPTFIVLLDVHANQLKRLPSGLWYVPSKVEAKNPMPVVEEDNVALIDRDGYSLTFRPVDKQANLIGKQFTHDICADWVLPDDDFCVGTIYEQFIHTVEPTCWSVNREKHGGWYKRRDDLTHKRIFAKGVANGC